MKGNSYTVGLDIDLYSHQSSTEFLKTPKMVLPFDLMMSLLCICPKETNSAWQRDTCPSVFIGTLSRVAEVWGHQGASEQMKGRVKWHVHLCYVMGCFHSHNIARNEHLSLTERYMDMKDILLSEVRNTVSSFSNLTVKNVHHKEEDRKNNHWGLKRMEERRRI